MQGVGERGSSAGINKLGQMCAIETRLGKSKL